MKKYLSLMSIFLASLLLLGTSPVFSGGPDKSMECGDNLALWRDHPFYLGVTLGWGTTDWSQLVAKYFNESEYNILTLSAPVSASDNGFVYGGVVGYEVTPHFAFESNFMRFPKTNIVFDQRSIYGYDYGIYSMNSYTYAVDLVGKVLVPIGSTRLRGFIDAGGAYTHRDDFLTQTGHICPTFGVGLDYTFHTHFMWLLAFQYYAGFGEATVRPAINYIPFLYTLYTGLAYRF